VPGGTGFASSHLACWPSEGSGEDHASGARPRAGRGVAGPCSPVGVRTTENGIYTGGRFPVPADRTSGGSKARCW
jgi:hypothetical protein